MYAVCPVHDAMLHEGIGFAEGQKRACDCHAAFTCTLPFAQFAGQPLLQALWLSFSVCTPKSGKRKTKMLEHAIPKTHKVKWGAARWASFQAEKRGFYNKHAAAAQHQGHFRFVQARHE
jgi:hypothetical protein